MLIRRLLLCISIVSIACLSSTASGQDRVTFRFVSTWSKTQPAVVKSRQVMLQGGKLLDAVEQGIRVEEANVNNSSVGMGGVPNADGVVQLDACIMNGPGHQAGAVGALEDIRHPISVARRVMETTRHVMLVGDGAQKFALENGFAKVQLLSDAQRQAWHERQAKQQPHAAPELVPAQHDTIALLGVDADGNLAGGCSTSGLGYKLAGRVGDSPIIGSGLYVDNEVGAAGATGVGENVMRYCGSFMVVEAMRYGKTPQEACEEVIRRIAAKDPKALDELHINFVAIDKSGRIGAAGTDQGFEIATSDPTGDATQDAAWITD